MVVALISSLFAPLVFLGGFYTALIGMALWGVGMGAQESIMRAAVALMYGDIHHCSGFICNERGNHNTC